MSEERYFPAWSNTDCDECGCEFQVTRTEPKTTSKVICSDCDAYFRGYYDGRLEIESLQSQVAELQKRNEWISVDDRLPSHSERILLLIESPNIEEKIPETGYYILNHGHSRIRHDGSTQKPFQRANGDETCMFDKDDYEYFIVTHWMPLPEQPSINKESDKYIKYLRKENAELHAELDSLNEFNHELQFQNNLFSEEIDRLNANQSSVKALTILKARDNISASTATNDNNTDLLVEILNKLGDIADSYDSTLDTDRGDDK